MSQNQIIFNNNRIEDICSYQAIVIVKLFKIDENYFPKAIIALMFVAAYSNDPEEVRDRFLLAN